MTETDKRGSWDLPADPDQPDTFDAPGDPTLQDPSPTGESPPASDPGPEDTPWSPMPTPKPGSEDSGPAPEVRR